MRPLHPPSQSTPSLHPLTLTPFPLTHLPTPSPHSIQVYAADKAPPLTSPGVAIDPGPVLTVSIPENTPVNLSYIGTIVSAKYGANNTFTDVTSLLCISHLTLYGTLKFPVTNENLGGDPCPNVPKTLIIQYIRQPLTVQELSDQLCEAGAHIASNEFGKFQASYNQQVLC